MRTKCEYCHDTGTLGLGEECFFCEARTRPQEAVQATPQNVSIQYTRNHPKAVEPRYAKPGDAGFDLSSVEYYRILPGETTLIDTGLAFAIPEGFELQIRPRSGRSLKTKLRVANAPGTIDSGYRDTVKVIVDNTGIEPIHIAPFERIAQGVLQRVPKAVFEEVDELDETERGKDGFGSTGDSVEK